MASSDLFARVSRAAWPLVFVVLACYAIGFFAFYPETIMNKDESGYLHQAQLMVEGAASYHQNQTDPLTGEVHELQATPYPRGTAFLMFPFVALFGENGAYMASLLCLLTAMLVVARWIADEGGSPLFALVAMSFPAALVMRRVAMSDVPGMWIAALGLYSFWKGIDADGPGYWLISGYLPERVSPFARATSSSFSSSISVRCFDVTASCGRSSSRDS